MEYYIKVEDNYGEAKASLRFRDEDTAYKVFRFVIDGCKKEGYCIKLMNDNFHVLSAYHTSEPNILANSEI
jgi:hypothetical protein